MTSSNMQEATPHPQKFVDEAREIVNQFGLDADGDTKVTNHDIAYLIDLIALALQTSHDEGVREEREACMDAVRDVIGERFDTNGDLLAALKAIEARQRSSK